MPFKNHCKITYLLTLLLTIAILASGNAADATGKASLNTALFNAIDNNDLRAVQTLLARGADVQARDEYQMTPLMAALNNCDSSHVPFKIIEALLAKKADVNAKDPSGDSVLVYAVNNDSDVAVKLLLQHGANANSQDQYGNTVLSNAIDHSGPEVIKTLLNAGAKAAGELPLLALRSDDTSLAQLFIKHGADVNESTALEKTPLMFATFKGHLKMLQFLLKNGAKVNAKSPTEGSTALMETISYGRMEAAKLLLQAGADPNAQDAGANPNLTGADGKTALMLLAENGRNKIAENLPRLRVNVLHRADEGAEKPTDRDVKPAEAAAMQKWADEGDIAIIKVLLAKKADLAARNKDKQTALIIAAQNSSAAVVQELIKAGADISAKDAAGQNALMQVVQKGHISRAPKLFSFELQNAVQAIEHGIKSGNEFYNTPEVKASAAETKAAAAKQQAEVTQRAAAQDVAIIKVLLSAGIDPNAKDNKGQTALQKAKQLHHAAIIDALEQAAKYR